MVRKKKGKRGAGDMGSAPGPLPTGHPLLAVPMVADGVEWKPDSTSCAQIRKTVVPTQGLRGWMARLLRQKYYARVDLDAKGTLFWRQVDGKRNLAQIAARLQGELGLTKEAAEECVILFVKDLMKHGLICLRVEREDGHVE